MCGFISQTNILQELVLSHVTMLKMVLLLIITSVVIKLVDQFGN